MDEWKEYKLGEVVNILDSKRIPLSSKERSARQGCYPYYGAQGIIDYIDDYIFDGTYLLIAEDGENLKSQKQNVAQLASGKYWVNNHAHILESNGESDIRYICYLLNTLDLSGYITGSAQPKLNQANLVKIAFKLPPLEIQKDIADCLSVFDNKIEVNRKINENLEQQAQALFKSWFVDFEPFKDGEFEESELGMIPKGWRVGAIGDYCKVRSGYAFKSSWWSNSGIPVVKIKNITDDGRLDMTDSSFVSNEHADLAKEFQTKVGDLLIAMTGATIGKFCIVHSNNKLCVNQRVGKFFLGENPLKKLPFVYYNLRRPNVFEEIVRRGQGSAQPNISGKDIETISIIYPSEEIISQFNILLYSLFEKIICNLQESRRLASLRDTLLPKLMSGEIKVNDMQLSEKQ
jgi:type I restriction enzyme S subunit